MNQKIIRALIAIWLALIPYRISYAAGADRARSLSRTVDPLVLTGEQLKTLAGRPTGSYGLFAFLDGRWAMIPFQIDEKTAMGDYAFEVWLEGREKRDDGLLDGNDELVFMAADLGDRPADLAWPESATDCVEIVATDPDDGGQAWGYFCLFETEAPGGTTDYVTFHVDRGEIETMDYIVGDDPKAPLSIGKVIVKPQFGGKGQDVADRLKIRVDAISALNLFELHRTEEDFKVKVMGYTDGPVRVIRHTRAWQVLFWNIPSPSSYQTSVYYRNQMQFPITVDVPFDVSMFFRDVSLRVSVDTPPNVPGRRYYNNHNLQGVDIDGKMSEAEKGLNRDQVGWQVLAGTTAGHPEGWLSRQAVRSSKETPITLPLWYVDDDTRLDPPENIPGCHGNLGFAFQGIGMLKKGAVEIDVKQFPLLHYSPGDEDLYLKVDDRPLKIEVLHRP